MMFPLFPVEEQKSEIVTTKTDAAAIVETVKGAADVANFEPKLVEAAVVKPDELKTLNNTSNDVAVNKTTTTVTVNVTQTKVTTVDDTKKSQELDEVVSTVTSIAEAAVSAIEKVEKPESKKPNTSETAALDDIEMAEVDGDCEMKDISQVAEDPAEVVTTTSTTTTGSSSVESSSSKQPKTVEADSAAISTTAANVVEGALLAGNNEAEQKIDDVEKNISNLFNGDDNVVSTNDKLAEDLTKSEASVVSSQNAANSLKNGMAESLSRDTPSHDAIKDNNDLVSILAGNDKPDENISSSISAAEARRQKSTTNSESKATEASSTKDVTEALAAGKPSANSIENKLLKGVTSTPSNTTTQTNVYNSTPIQKQFEISSENVSTISEPAFETEHHGLGRKSTTRQEIISSHSSTINEKSLDLSSTVTGQFD